LYQLKNFVYLPQKNKAMGYKEKFRYVLPLLRNKYSLTFIIFFVWVIFFDSNNLYNRIKNLNRVHTLEKEIIFYNEKIKNDRVQLEELKSNPANLEKFARENFLMKKDNEDIFIVGD